MSKFWEAYNIERNKLSPLPDADSDFIALDNTIKNNPELYLEEFKERLIHSLGVPEEYFNLNEPVIVD